MGPNWHWSERVEVLEGACFLSQKIQYLCASTSLEIFLFCLQEWDDESVWNSGDFLTAFSHMREISKSNSLCFFFFELDILSTMTTVFIC